MSIIGSNVLAGASGSGVEAYEIEQSLRFDDGGSTYLNRTPSSAGNQKTWTFSAWLKRGSFTANQGIFNPVYGGDGSNESQIRWKSDNTLQIYDAGGTSFNFVTTQVFRDPSAWYHLVVAVDTTQATEANRFKLYINGEQITAFGTSTYPAQNYTTGWNGTSRHDIGRYAQGGNLYYGGYMAEVHQIDGTQLDPTSFGEEDEFGVWRPIEYTGGSYGTNGFYMKFDETASNGIGHDHSGQGNNFTASGFTTSGTGTDVFSDTPTKNWCTVNSLSQRQYLTVEDGNLEIAYNNSGNGVSVTGTHGASSGKWYWETTMTTASGADYVGVVTSGWDVMGKAGTAYPGSQNNGWTYFRDGRIYHNGSFSSYGDSYTTGDVIGLALDLDNNKIYFSKNGTYQNSSNPSTATNPAFTNVSGTVFPVWAGYNTSTVHTCNFGQREFANPPGTIGATDYFNTVLYTGNGSTQSVTGVGFQPDLVFAKNRDSLNGWRVYDVGRGVQTQIQLDSTNQEETVSTGLTSFDSDGFTLGSSGGINGSGIDFAAYCWKAGGTGSANNSGSLDATVSANNDAGFSVVTYTGNSTSGATFAHGLDTAPSFVILKNRDSSSQGWMIYHSGMGATKAIQFTASGELTDTAYWNDTAPSSTLVTLGNDNATNATGDDYMAYCWAEKTGVSKFGSYTGNGSSTEGPVITCGFRPAMVMIKWYKDVSTSESWQLYDNKRAGNPTNTILQPDSAGAEETPSDRHIQFNADGFQLKANGQQINRSGAKYIFMAWAATFTDGDFKSLNTANLPEPAVKDGSKYFDTKLYTANSQSAQTISGFGFSPDWLWFKTRGRSEHHYLYDQVRGAGNRISSSQTITEVTGDNSLTAFTSDGFSLGADGAGIINYQTDSMVAWAWEAGGSVSADNNTNGDITSTVSASPTSGFSIVGYTGNGVGGQTVGHGLGVTPKMVWVKNRESAKNWYVRHDEMDSDRNVILNTNAAQFNISTAGSGGIADLTSGSSTTVFTLQQGSGNVNNVNQDTDDHIAYCFAEVESFSKFGKYTGNGNNDGPFVFTGFLPSVVLTKRVSSTSNWILLDNKRDVDNPAENWLRPNSDGIEESTGPDLDIDFLANGFKIRNNSTDQNISGSTYIYAAFAKHPMGGSGVSPSTAR